MRPSRTARTLIVPLAVIVVVACSASLHAQTARAAVPRAPHAQLSDSATLSRGRFLASFPLAALLGTAGTIVGALAGYGLLECQDESSHCEHGPDNGEVLTGAAGLALGAALGAYLGGRRSDSRGHFWADLLAASGGALLLVTDAVNDPENDEGRLIVAGLIVAPLAAAITDHFVRQPRRPRRVSIQPTPLGVPPGLSVTVRM
jgi:peptidoglycan/LPS O-acetylase OafA/YrhL